MNDQRVSLLVVGDSHVMGYNPQQLAVKSHASNSVPVMLRPVFMDGGYSALDLVVTFFGGRTGLNPLLEEILRHWPGLDVKGNPLEPGPPFRKELVLSFGTALSGYDPLIDFNDRRSRETLLFRPDVDFVLPDRPNLYVDPTCTLFPVALIRRMFDEMLTPLKQALDILAERFAGRLWIVGSPPPPRTNDTKLRTVTERAAEMSLNEAITLANPMVSLKAWLLVTDLVRIICAEKDCKFIDCSPIACDADGFMKDAFNHDGFHGNTLYFEKMTQQLISSVVTSVLAEKNT